MVVLAAARALDKSILVLFTTTGTRNQLHLRPIFLPYLRQWPQFRLRCRPRPTHPTPGHLLSATDAARSHQSCVLPGIEAAAGYDLPVFSLPVIAAANDGVTAELHLVVESRQCKLVGARETPGGFIGEDTSRMRRRSLEMRSWRFRGEPCHYSS